MANSVTPQRSKRGLYLTLAILAVIVVIVVLTMDRKEIETVITHEEPQVMIIQPGASAELGQKAPDFALPDTEGRIHRLSDHLSLGKIVVLEWFNPDCPFVIKHHVSARTMADLHSAHAGEDVVWLAVNSGAPGKQGHGLDRNRRAIEEYGIRYPLLIDETGVVGMAYGAKTTPHMYVIDREGMLLYRGAIDSDRSAGTLGEVNHVAQALDEIMAGRSVTVPETQPYGCSVKYPD